MKNVVVNMLDFFYFKIQIFMCLGVWEMGSKMFDLMYIHTYLKTLAGEQ